jgi:hypothetical protein
VLECVPVIVYIVIVIVRVSKELVFLGKNKLTFDNGDELRFWVHWKLARSAYHDMKILDVSQFDKADWEMVHTALWRVP